MAACFNLIFTIQIRDPKPHRGINGYRAYPDCDDPAC